MLGKRGILILSFFLIFLNISYASASVMINEVMPHSNNSYGDEWVEIYNNENSMLNLTNWKIADAVSNDSISLTIAPYGFAIIADSSIGCSNFNLSNESCAGLSTIGSGLNDDNETIYLYDNSSALISSFSWNENLKQSGKSFGYNGTAWLNCTPTPGTANNCTVQQIPQQNQTNQTQQQNQTNQEHPCMLEFIEVPPEAYFGSSISINLSGYRNNTAKYAVRLWIEDSEEERATEELVFHADNKSANFTFTASIDLEERCNVDENLTFRLIIEGLDERINKSLTLNENSTLCLPDFEYFILPQETTRINETFTTSVEIRNNKDIKAKFEVWSYVFRGSKCYSCIPEENRNGNIQQVEINANSKNTVILSNSVTDAEPGDYTLKVQILRSSRKIPKDFNFAVSLLEMHKISEQGEMETNLNAQNFSTASSAKQAATGKAVYSSKAGVDRKLVGTIFLSAMLMAAVCFLARRMIIRTRENGV
ncbi:MAG: lamin tail domain-containing protein [archaeon]